MHAVINSYVAQHRTLFTTARKPRHRKESHGGYILKSLAQAMAAMSELYPLLYLNIVEVTQMNGKKRAKETGKPDKP